MVAILWVSVVSRRSGCGWSPTSRRIRLPIGHVTQRRERRRPWQRWATSTPRSSMPSNCGAWLERVEALRRTVEAAAVAAAGVIDRSNPFRAQGFFSAKTAVKHMCKLSGPEAHRRVQTARLHHALPDWATAEADGAVGVAQCELMARVGANPRIPTTLLDRDTPSLLDDAISQPFDEFERRARRWEALHRATNRRRPLPRPPSAEGTRIPRVPRRRRHLARHRPPRQRGQLSTDSGTPTIRARSHSPSAFACASWRVDAATPSCRSPRITKFSARRFG